MFECVRMPFSWGVLDTTLYDKVCQWLATGRWFSPVSSTNKADLHDITEILLKVELNAITRTQKRVDLRRTVKKEIFLVGL
jgi:hypothetical protein